MLLGGVLEWFGLTASFVTTWRFLPVRLRSSAQKGRERGLSVRSHAAEAPQIGWIMGCVGREAVQKYRRSASLHPSPAWAAERSRLRSFRLLVLPGVGFFIEIVGVACTEILDAFSIRPPLCLADQLTILAHRFCRRQSGHPRPRSANAVMGGKWHPKPVAGERNGVSFED